MAALRASYGGFSSGLPECVETVLVGTAKGFKVEERSRRFVDLPGHNHSRGLQNLPLKSPVEFNSFKIPRSAHSILNKSTKAVDAKDDDDQHSDQVESESTSLVLSPEDELAFHPWPWATSTILWKEIINMWQGAGVTTIVDFTLGAGSLLMASMKMNVGYVCIVQGALHAQILQEAVTLVAVLEAIRMLPDSLCSGALGRVLSRKSSNSGRRAEADPALLNAAKDDAPKKEKTSSIKGSPGKAKDDEDGLGLGIGIGRRRGLLPEVLSHSVRIAF